MQEICNSITNTLELRLSCTNPSIYTFYAAQGPEWQNLNVFCWLPNKSCLCAINEKAWNMLVKKKVLVLQNRFSIRYIWYWYSLQFKQIVLTSHLPVTSNWQTPGHQHKYPPPPLPHQPYPLRVHTDFCPQGALRFCYHVSWPCNKLNLLLFQALFLSMAEQGLSQWEKTLHM